MLAQTLGVHVQGSGNKAPRKLSNQHPSAHTPRKTSRSNLVKQSSTSEEEPQAHSTSSNYTQRIKARLEKQNQTAAKKSSSATERKSSRLVTSQIY